MIGASAVLTIVLASALIVGQAIAGFAAGSTRERPLAFSWLGPAYGIAALLVVAGIAIRLPGHATTAAVALVAVALIAAVYLWRGGVTGVGECLAVAAPVVAITVLAAAFPFAIAGDVGILGAGLVNDDMASHLIIADYIREYSGQVPSFIKGGYPIGPHAVVAGYSELTGAGLVESFAGFTVALAPLLGLLGIGLLGRMSRTRLVAGASLIALPYLGAAYLSQGAFKEPLQAILLIGFAVALASLIGMRTPSTAGSPVAGIPQPHPIRRILPLAILAAASVFNYSLPGLLWIAAVGTMVLLARLLLVRPRPELPDDWLRRAAPYLLGLLVVVAIATAGEWSRIADFSRLSALNPDRFGSALGNLSQSLSPLEALGIWLTGEFDATATSAGLPAPVFYLGALLGLAALILGLIRERREGSWTLPALLVAMAGVWILASLFSSPYIAAKALAIASPVVIAIALRGTLGGRGPALALGIVLIVGAAGSSFLVLRGAAVGPDGHAAQLTEIRPLVEGEPVLFLGRDDFIGWELSGSDEITGIVTNFYDVEDARPRFKKGEGGGEKFDVDAVFPATLDSFPFILATTGGPASVVPPRFQEVERTRDYVLYERTGSTGKRRTLDEGTEPGAVLDCDTPAGREIAQGKGTAIVWNTPPVIAGAELWEPDDSPSDGSPAALELAIPEAGRWLISLAYDSRRHLRISAPELGLDETLAANLDFRGETPTFPVAEIEVDEPINAIVTAEPTAPNLIGRLLRAPNEAHLRELTATPLDPDAIERVQVRQTCDRYVDWYREG